MVESTRFPEARMAANPNRKLSFILMGGHLATDINQGAINAVLPFLVMYNDFTYTQVAMVVFGLNILSAIVQPLFGILGDRKACPWFMALGVFLAGLGLFGVGRFHSLPAIVLSAMVSGFGVAMFHPEGGRLSNLVAGERKGRGMSIFAVGGNIGFATGPILVSIFLGAFGMDGTFIFLVPAIGYSLFLLSYNKRFKEFGLVDKKVVSQPGSRDRWGAFFTIIGAMSVRAIIFSGSMAFLPLFAVNVLGLSEATGSLMITLYSGVGVFATMLSGRVSEKISPGKLLCICLAVIVCLLGILIMRPTLAVTMVVVVLLAAAMNLCYPSTVALGQSMLPNHLGTASGLSYGVVTAIGGIASPGLGAVGDAFGLVPVFMLMALAGAISFCMALGVVKIEKTK